MIRKYCQIGRSKKDGHLNAEGRARYWQRGPLIAPNERRDHERRDNAQVPCRKPSQKQQEAWLETQLQHGAKLQLEDRTKDESEDLYAYTRAQRFVFQSLRNAAPMDLTGRGSYPFGERHRLGKALHREPSSSAACSGKRGKMGRNIVLSEQKHGPIILTS